MAHEEIRGKIILVTGASSGIGRAVASKLVARQSDFDWFVGTAGISCGGMFGLTSTTMRCALRFVSNESCAFVREHHAMHCGWRHAEMALQIGLCRGAAQHQRLGGNDGQILALFCREAGQCRGVTRDLSVCPQP